MKVEDVGYREEKVALLQIIKPVFATEAKFLRDASDAERLAWKTGAKDIVRRDVGDGNGMDVAVGSLAKICGVSLLAEFVVVGRENALRAGLLKSDSESANSAEQVHKAKTIRYAIEGPVLFGLGNFAEMHRFIWRRR